MPTLPDLLRAYREQCGLSQEEWAALVQPPLSPDTISNLERGRTRPHRHTLEALCQALELDDRARQAVWAAWRAVGSGKRPVSGALLTAGSGTGPAQPTPLIGRDAELRLLQQRLLQPHLRLLTLVGPGGVGKTRLALGLLRDIQPLFTDGAWFVDLSPLRDAGLVVPTIAHALGIRETGEQPVQQGLMDALRARNLLLVLDNFEHLLQAATSLAEVLSACPAVKVLATSREPLRLRWEHLHIVPPLGVPDAHDLASVDAVQAAPAVALFLDRARAADASFTLTEANVATIATLCRRLDGLPLALELAAARVRTLSPPMLLDHLDRRLDLLRGARDAPARQQSLRATLDWSYDLLSEAEQRLFEQLSVFAGGWTVAAAEAVCARDGLTAEQVLDGLGRLLDSCLVETEEQTDEVRCRFLESVRQYAAGKLRDHGEDATLAGRHAAWCLALAEAAAPEVTGPDQQHWLVRLEAEHDNLRSALSWCVQTGEADLGLRMVGALHLFWQWGGHIGEGHALAQRLLALPGATQPSVARGKALFAAGNLAELQGGFAEARDRWTEQLEIGNALADRHLVAYAHRGLGTLALDIDDLASARGHTELGLTLFAELGDRFGEAVSLHFLGEIAGREQDWPTAHQFLERALALQRQLGDPWGIAHEGRGLGYLALRQGDYPAARAAFEGALAIERALGRTEGVGHSLLGLGWVALEQGQCAEAERLFSEALAAELEVGRTLWAPRTLPGRGWGTEARSPSTRRWIGGSRPPVGCSVTRPPTPPGPLVEPCRCGRRPPSPKLRQPSTATGRAHPAARSVPRERDTAPRLGLDPGGRRPQRAPRGCRDHPGT